MIWIILLNIGENIIIVQLGAERRENSAVERDN